MKCFFIVWSAASCELLVGFGFKGTLVAQQVDDLARVHTPTWEDSRIEA